MPHQSSVKPIQFFFQQPVTLKNRKALRQFIQWVFKKEKCAFKSLQLVFCSDEYLLPINRQFLKHDDYTDIISFNLAPAREPVEGEIYISIDRVKENARKLKEPFTRELHRVVFHGVLHFCGFKDKNKKDQALMRKKEDYYLKTYFPKVPRITVS